MYIAVTATVTSLLTVGPGATTVTVISSAVCIHEKGHAGSETETLATKSHTPGQTPVKRVAECCFRPCTKNIQGGISYTAARYKQVNHEGEQAKK